MLTTLRSLAFNVALHGTTALLLIAMFWGPYVFSRPATLAFVKTYMRLLVVYERFIVGMRYEVLGREKLPDGPCIIAAKHQSMWETMKLHLLFDDPAVILKRELMKIPVWGRFAAKLGMIPVDRGARGRAVESIIEGARPVVAAGRPIVIFPQGTRTAPGSWRPYKIGVFALAEALELPVVPVALNSGVFWGRKAFHKRPGLITVEIGEPIQPGTDRDAFMQQLEETIETASDRLVASVGGPVLGDRAGLDGSFVGRRAETVATG